jgi:uncharacterized coiled-coil protein SlyX
MRKITVTDTEVPNDPGTTHEVPAGKDFISKADGSIKISGPKQRRAVTSRKKVEGTLPKDDFLKERVDVLEKIAAFQQGEISQLKEIVKCQQYQINQNLNMIKLVSDSNYTIPMKNVTPQPNQIEYRK